MKILSFFVAFLKTRTLSKYQFFYFLFFLRLNISLSFFDFYSFFLKDVPNFGRLYWSFWYIICRYEKIRVPLWMSILKFKFWIDSDVSLWNKDDSRQIKIRNFFQTYNHKGSLISKGILNLAQSSKKCAKLLSLYFSIYVRKVWNNYFALFSRVNWDKIENTYPLEIKPPVLRYWVKKKQGLSK